MKNEAYFWIFANPNILLQRCSLNDTVGPFLPNTPIYRLMGYGWDYKPNELLDLYQSFYNKRRDHYTFLINDANIYRSALALGIPCIHCNHNAFIDETLFKPSKVSKKYNAISVGRICPEKRHQLANQIENALIVGYQARYDNPSNYINIVKSEMPNSSYLVSEQVDTQIPQDVVLEKMNESLVGLCLSEREGAMNVSVEYLLCGLPVVSTLNYGGRNEFLDPEYCMNVPPSPEAVSHAVHDLINRKIPSDYIRSRTIRKLQEHRSRFIIHVQSIFEKEQIGIDYGKMFYQKFFNKYVIHRPRNLVTHYLQADVEKSIISKNNILIM